MATSKLPIVLLIRNAAKNDFGGAETYTVSIASLLSQNNFHPIVVSRSQKVLDHAYEHSIDTRRGWWWSNQNWNGKRVAFFPVYIIWQFFLTLWYMQLIFRTRAEVLHIQSKDDFIAGTIAARLLRRRTVWTDHMDLRYIFQNISRPLRNPLGKFVFWAAKFSDHIILISENEHKLVTSHFKNKDDLNDKIVLVKNGVIDQRAKYIHDQHGSFSFCLASRMVVNKGVGEAIKAFISLQKHGVLKHSTTLDIYGDGRDIQEFKTLAAVHDNIIFHGHQANAIAKIADSDVFMLPSYQEGLSITLLEATMLGKAIIATDVDSNPEVIIDEHTGLLVKARDIGALADAMARVYINSTLRHELENGARSNYEKHFNLETIVKNEIIPLYSH